MSRIKRLTHWLGDLFDLLWNVTDMLPSYRRFNAIELLFIDVR
ncbi:MAG: hypothetical protein V3V18_09855 [Methylococcales bacterium]